MAITDAYSTPQSYREAMTKRDPGKDEDIQADIEAISRYMERKLHTFWTKDTVAVARYYMPGFRPTHEGWAEAENPWKYLRSDTYLNVDPIASTVGLEIVIDTDRDNSYADETPLNASDYILLPRNALVGPEPVPYNQIVKSDYSLWQPGAEVKITAIFGWPSVPKMIERLCNQLVGLWRFESPRARAITELDGTMEASRDAQMIIENAQRAYRRQPGFGIS